jgi:hypothetical protein
MVTYDENFRKAHKWIIVESSALHFPMGAEYCKHLAYSSLSNRVVDDKSEWMHRNVSMGHA